MSGLKHKVGRQWWREGWCFVQLQFFFSKDDFYQEMCGLQDWSCIWYTIDKFEFSNLVDLGQRLCWNRPVYETFAEATSKHHIHLTGRCGLSGFSRHRWGLCGRSGPTTVRTPPCNRIGFVGVPSRSIERENCARFLYEFN